MQQYIATRLVQGLFTLIIVSFLAFFLVRLKGDPVDITAPPTFNEDQKQRLRELWGFDKPLPEQYVIFITRAVTGNFGISYLSKRPAMELVIERLGATWLLAGVASLIGLSVALPLGIASALNRNSIFDLTSTMLASLGTAMPGFWLGLMLIIFFSVRLRLLPAFGMLEPAAIIMPALTMGVGMAAYLSRLTRSAMLEVLNEDYIRTAYSKGLITRTVVMRHAMKNALIPIMTVFGLQLGWLLGGSVVVESVFSWPGLGRLMIDSIGVRDNTVVQAALLFFALSFILINLVIDILYAVVDPRIRFD